MVHCTQPVIVPIHVAANVPTWLSGQPQSVPLAQAAQEEPLARKPGPHTHVDEAGLQIYVQEQRWA